MRNFLILLISILLFPIIGCEKTDTVPQESVLSEPIPFGEFIDDWTFKVNALSGHNFDVAEFRLWVPDGIEDLRAILVLCNYHNGNGIGLTQSEPWQDFARNEKLGLIGVHFKSYQNSAGYYSNASQGSGNALIKALDSLAQKNNLPEIKDLPFIMRGYSAGGVFSYNFSAYRPERVIAFVNIRGGSVGETISITKDIPGLMIIGENDVPTRIDKIKEIVDLKRIEGGLWSYAIEPEVDHFGGLQESDELSRAFFSSALSQRLNNNSNQLKTISEDTGWLGNNITKEIYPFDSIPISVDEASWLINEAFAIQWKNFQLN